MNKLETEFERYRKEVMPADASVDQIIDNRLAFYSGAGVAYKMTTSASFGVMLIKRDDLAEEIQALLEAEVSEKN